MSIFESQPCSFILFTIFCYAAVLEYQQHWNLFLIWIIKHPHCSFCIKRLSALLKTKLVFFLSQWSRKFFVIHCKHLSSPQWLKLTNIYRSCKIWHQLCKVVFYKLTQPGCILLRDGIIACIHYIITLPLVSPLVKRFLR